MKMTALLYGFPLKNRDAIGKNARIADNGGLLLKDGTEISYLGEENGGPNDCYNYADWTALEDTGFFEDDITAENLKIEKCEDSGLRINGYFVPCYSVQNGWYDNELDIKAVKDGKTVAEIRAVRGTVC